MHLQKPDIHPHSSPAEIVLQNHHTADVFRKYEIEYCCTGKWPLETICTMKGLDYNTLRQELIAISQPIYHSTRIAYDRWDIDFLIQYITNVHHEFLRNTLPGTAAILNRFAEEHKKKYPYMQEVYRLFNLLSNEIIKHITEEEKTIFPYILQVSHAYDNKDTYARLLVKTLRKPLDTIIKHEQEIQESLLRQIKEMTNNYRPPESSCISHKVALSRLKELDNDLAQHIHLEKDILLPKAIKIEQELLT